MKFTQTKLYKALFYKSELTPDKIRKEWALRPMKALPTLNVSQIFRNHMGHDSRRSRGNYVLVSKFGLVNQCPLL